IQTNPDKSLPRSSCDRRRRRMLLLHPELVKMRRPMFALLLPAVLWSASACADYRITRDHGGYLEDYKAKYARIRDRGERVIIDGICHSGCTIAPGIGPPTRVFVPPPASP